MGFVFSNDAIRLNPSIRTAEGDGAAKGHRIRRRRIQVAKNLAIRPVDSLRLSSGLAAQPQKRPTEPGPLLDELRRVSSGWL